MRSVRLAAVALAAAAMTACSSDITAPARNLPTGPSLSVTSCRSGYLLSSGRCSGDGPTVESVGTGPKAPTITTSDTGCRSGYLLSSGRCVLVPE